MDQTPGVKALVYASWVLYQSGKPTAEPSHREAGPLLGEMVQVYFTCRQPLGRWRTEIGKAPTTRTHIIIRKWMDGSPLFTFLSYLTTVNFCRRLLSWGGFQTLFDGLLYTKNPLLESNSFSNFPITSHAVKTMMLKPLKEECVLHNKDRIKRWLQRWESSIYKDFNGDYFSDI